MGRGLMRAELNVRAGGRDVPLRLPLGGLEEIAEVNPQIAELAIGLAQGQWYQKELEAVLRAGLKWGGSGMSLDEFWEASTINECVAVACRLLTVAFDGVDPGELTAADGTTPSA